MSLGLTGDVLHGSWWQLWTCHFAHWDARHLLLNLGAASPPMFLLTPALRRAFAWSSLIIAPALSVAVIASSVPGEYRGASGLVVALWVFSGVALLRGERRAGFLLLAAIGAKLLFEAAFGMPPSASFHTLPLIHYAGAVTGLFVALCLRGLNTESANLAVQYPAR